MDILIHVRMDIKYQKGLFMFKRVSTIPLLLLQMYEVRGLLGPPSVLRDSKAPEDGHFMLLKPLPKILFVL